jgi:hypothetical protein
MRNRHTEAELHISATDRIGNGIIAGFIATLALSAVHEPVALVTEAVGVRAPVAGWLFHFFVGTLLWGGVFGLLHDWLPGRHGCWRDFRGRRRRDRAGRHCAVDRRGLFGPSSPRRR